MGEREERGGGNAISRESITNTFLILFPEKGGRYQLDEALVIRFL